MSTLIETTVSEPAALPVQMLALVLAEDGPRIEVRPVPTPDAHEALVRVRCAGICSTDIELLRGYKGGYRGILGHEFVGEIVDAPQEPARIGQRVVGEINIGCGRCDLCQRGLHKHCRQRRVLGIVDHDGAFAEYLTLPLANLHGVNPRIPDDAAVFTEPLAAAVQVLEQVHIAPTARVYVLGAGRLGQLIAQALRLVPCDLSLLGRNRDKLAIASLRGIATVHLDSLDALLAEPADIVVEATGSPDGFALARRLVRPAGTIVLKSTFAAPLAGFDASGLVVDEVTVIGSRCGPFPPALRLLRTRAVDPRPLISARYPLAQGVEALAHATQAGSLKVLLDISQP